MTTKKPKNPIEPTRMLGQQVTEKEWLFLDGSSMCPSRRLGVEITARLVLEPGMIMDDVQEILDKAREYGTAEVTQIVEIVE